MLAIVIVPLEVVVVVGAKVMVNDALVFGARLSGSVGKLFRTKGAATPEIPVMRRFVVPVLVIVRVRFDEVLTVTLPKLMELGDTDIAGWFGGGASTEKLEYGVKLTKAETASPVPGPAPEGPVAEPQ